MQSTEIKAKIEQIANNLGVNPTDAQSNWVAKHCFVCNATYTISDEMIDGVRVKLCKHHRLN